MSAKDLKNKPKLQLLKMNSLAGIAKVREFGMKKYGDNSGWETVPPDEFIGAALRHLYKHLEGERYDDESGLEHLHHAMCSLMLASEILKKD